MGKTARTLRERLAQHRANPVCATFHDVMDPIGLGLENFDAIGKWRTLMGATDPKKAAKGTIRADFADSIDANAVHGSDAPETAAAGTWSSRSTVASSTIRGSRPVCRA